MQTGLWVRKIEGYIVFVPQYFGGSGNEIRGRNIFHPLISLHYARKANMAYANFSS